MAGVKETRLEIVDKIIVTMELVITAFKGRIMA
jgi:hypothetical protein